ncbi:MAG: DegV family EDD domain-containing protein [Bacteroidales bacterium]|nr:DegV family EDD domain-containing protein [Bacteroidales bacterium]
MSPSNEEDIMLEAALINTKVLNGKRFYFSFLAGAQQIFEHQNALNKINVFPVQDGDTGTNMASTMRAIIDSHIPTGSLKDTAEALADAALMGARGNSGIIFAQFLYGFSSCIQDIEDISVEKFSKALKEAVRFSYESISNPVEGTMITVMREWAEAIDKLKEGYDDFNELIIVSLKDAQKSLAATPEKLEILRKKKVVDAGGKAFVHFLEGMIDYFTHGDIKRILKSRNVVKIENLNDNISHEDVNFRYCTEALLILEESRPELKEIIRAQIEYLGDSLVIAGSSKKIRLHIHTDTPAKLFQQISGYGNITYQKVDDMIMQNDLATTRKFSTGLITDSTCDLPQDIIDQYQIQVVPVKVHFGEKFFLDGLTLSPLEFYKQLDTAKIYPNTSQPSYHDFLNKYEYLSSYYDSILSIHLSKKLSGLWSNSNKAGATVANQQNKDISVLNSKKTASGLGLIVLRSAQAIAAGASKADIENNMEAWAKNTKMLVSTKTIKYLMKSGRVSPMKGIFGKLISLKPLLVVNDEGTIDLFGKPVTEKGSIALVQKEMRALVGNHKVWGYAISHADNLETAQIYIDEMKKLTGREPEFVSPATPALAVHAGPGVVALSIMLD